MYVVVASLNGVLSGCLSGRLLAGLYEVRTRFNDGDTDTAHYTPTIVPIRQTIAKRSLSPS